MTKNASATTDVHTHVSKNLPTVTAGDDRESLAGDVLDPFIGTCPTWCKYSSQHSFDYAPEDRVHFGESLSVPLQLERAVQMYSGPCGALAWVPNDVRVTAKQNYREAEPTIDVGSGDDHAFSLTMGETWTLIEMLQLILGQIECGR